MSAEAKAYALHRLVRQVGEQLLGTCQSAGRAGSDRACERWRRDCRVEGADDLGLHHLYRTMAWLGEDKEAVEKALVPAVERLRERFATGVADRRMISKATIRDLEGRGLGYILRASMRSVN